MKAKLIFSLAIVLAGLSTRAQYLEELTKKPVCQASGIDYFLQKDTKPGQVQQYVTDKNGAWALNATCTNVYTADGHLESKLYVPTPFNKTGYELETIKTAYLENNNAGKPVLIKRYALRNGVFVEVEKKTKVYDDHGNLTEVHTLYKGEKEYVYANYDGSYKFHYTYNEQGQPSSIESEYYFLGYSSGWYKGSKRFFTYDATGNISSIERLPFSFLANGYTHSGGFRYSNIRMTNFSFEQFFAANQNLDALENVEGYTLERWNDATNCYQVIKKNTVNTALNSSETVKSIEEENNLINYHITKEPNTGLVQSVAFESEQQSLPIAAVQHNYVYDADGRVKEEIIQEWDADAKRYVAKERKVYGAPALTAASNGKNTNISVFPNPITASSKVNYSLAEESKVVIELYTLLGAKVNTVLEEVQSAGAHQVELKGIAAGNYLLKVQLGTQTYSEQVVKTDN